MSRSVLVWALTYAAFSVMAGGCSVEGEVEAVDTAVPVPTEADSQASAGGLAPNRGSDAVDSGPSGELDAQSGPEDIESPPAGDASASTEDVPSDEDVSTSIEDDGDTSPSAEDVPAPEEDVEPPEEDVSAAEEDVAEPKPPVDVEEGCAVDECDIDGQCYANQAPHPDTPCLRCVVLVNATQWSAADEVSCDDGDPCTVEDTCRLGQCEGAPLICDDADPCTAGSCDVESGDCVFAPAAGPCDDGDACTLGDQCDAGVCLPGASMICDDGNGCMTGQCLEGECVFEPNTESCDDGDICTLDDTCIEGVCVGSLDTCDDANVCTLDTCIEVEGCIHQDMAELCDDGDLCTDDACTPELGCVYTFNTVPCDDGSECTVDDACLQGQCTGPDLVVDDGNPCTDDSCDPAVGAVYVNNTSPCEDGDVCTLGDSCSDGSCSIGPVQKVCADDEPCTDDACDPELGCTFVPNANDCDDESVCTTDDICSEGTCTGDQVACDDGEPCTAEVCDPVEGCSSTLIVSNECRPSITVTSPPRGATIAGILGGSVEVTGVVEKTGSEITSVTLNGELLELGEGGEFTALMPAVRGGNTIVVEAEDALGGTRRVVQAFLYGMEYLKPAAFKTEMVNSGAGNWSSAAAMDDLAPIMGEIFGSVDLTSGFPDPITEDLTHKWSVDKVTFDTPVIDIELFDGGMTLTNTINNMKIDLDASPKVNCIFFFCTPLGLPYGADMNIQKIVVTVDVLMGLDADKELEVIVGDAVTDISGVSGGLNIPFGGFFDGLVSFFLNFFTGAMEEQFSAGTKGLLEAQFKASFEAFTQTMEFPLPSFNPAAPPTVVQVASEFEEFEITAAGIRVVTNLGGYTSESPIDASVAIDHLGYPVGACELEQEHVLPLPMAADIEIVMADDAMNGLMYAGWRAGMMDFEASPEFFAAQSGGMDMSALGVEDLEMTVRSLLPPVLSDCTYGPGEPTVHMGDMVIESSMTLFGTPMDIVMYVTMEAGFELGIGDGLMTFGLTEMKALEIQTEIAQEDLVSSESLLTAMVEETMVPALLAGFGGEEAGFPIPEIDFGGGAAFGIDASTIVREQGFSLISGGIQ